MPRRLTNLRIDEVSSVDRGAGKGVRVLLMKRHADSLYTSIEKGDLDDDAVAYLKREFSSEERQSAADSGAALPDGSFPIKNKSDLKNAIQAIGRAKDRSKAMAHIKSRARALGATDMLPDNWQKRDEATIDKALTLAVGSILAEGGNAGEIVQCFKEFHAFLGGEPTSKESDMTDEQIAKLVSDSVAKALKDAGVELNKMTADHAAYHSNLDGDEAKRFQAMGHDDRQKYMKEHPISGDGGDGGDGGDSEDNSDGGADENKEKKARKMLEKAFGADFAKNFIAPAKDVEIAKRDKTISDLTKRLSSLEDDKQRTSFAKRALEIGLTEKDGDMLLKAHRGDPEAITKLEDAIKALHVQVEKAGLFNEIGSTGGAAATAHEEMVNKANEIRKTDAKLTYEQAYVKAMENNPELYARVKKEQDQRVAKLGV